jgi:hypothetical protein
VNGDYSHKIKEASCQLNQIEPYSPWQNAAKGNIREHMNGAGQKMIKSGMTALFWNLTLGQTLK